MEGGLLRSSDSSAMQREELERWVRRPKTAQALALRARIVQRGGGAELGTTRVTVGKWRRRFLQSGCDAWRSPPRHAAYGVGRGCGARRDHHPGIDPSDATHWSTRSIARVCGLSAATWVRPARGKDPLFIDQRPSARAGGGLVRRRVRCRTDAPPGPALRRPERGDWQSARACHVRHRAVEFIKFLRAIDKAVPAETSRSGQLWDPQDGDDPPVARAASPLSPALHPHECVVAQPGRALVRPAHRKQIRRGTHRSTAELEQAIIDPRHEDPKPFVWTKTADQILAARLTVQEFPIQDT